MQYGYSILYVADVAQTIAFYEHAFGLTRRLLADSGEYGELETGATRLAFANVAFARSLTLLETTEAKPEAPAPPVEIGFVTEDVEAAFSRAVSAGAREVKKPTRKPWGQMVGYVRDLNGFLIEVCSPLP